MDPLTGLLSGPRAHGAFVIEAVGSPPWSIRIEDEAPLTVLAMIGGQVQIWFDGQAPVALGPGDVALVKGPDHYTVADQPDRQPTVRVDADQHCYLIGPDDPVGQKMPDDSFFGTRSWGNDPDGSIHMLVGTYLIDSEVGRGLLDSLPPLARLGPADWDGPVVALLADEVGRDGPGQEVVLDRLLDLVLVTMVRAWFDRPDSVAPRWFLGRADPVVGDALQRLHDRPDHRWTVAELAREAGVSRAALARRFTDLVGEPPMTFLTNWRLTLAADLLCEPSETVTSVAAKVGYQSPYAFSSAFKRSRGMSPRDYRAARIGG
jgi:AraC-like DNA-binding protein